MFPSARVSRSRATKRGGAAVRPAWRFAFAPAQTRLFVRSAPLHRMRASEVRDLIWVTHGMSNPT